MKTGRVRRKEPPQKPPETDAAPQETTPTAAPPPPPAVAAVQPSRPRSSSLVLLVFVFIVVVIAIMAILTLTRGSRTDEWVAVTRANGAWTTNVALFGPQVVIEEMWESDCTSATSGAVQPGTCVLRDTDRYQDTVVEDYEEYAYNIYFDETWSTIYQAQGTEFVVTTLGRDDWWEGNLHYTRVEELDRDSCQYTTYTVWVDDPNDSTQETEVFLSECEVWDHVTVEERTYDQAMWCQCGLTRLVQLGQQSSQGTGASVTWPQPTIPQGGRTEPSFSGKVTLVGDDYTYTVTTEDVNAYQDYLTGQYYIGIRKGKPVGVSKNPPK